jgi:cysteine desulfurase/selenocysteine lyase
MLDLRNDFPVLNRKINGRPIVYLDSACMALKPKQVVNAMNEYYEQYPACGGRSIHKFGEEASNAYTASREKFASFLNAAEPEECIWTRNATESLNIVAACVKLPSDGKIVTTTLEHHSGSLPFVERARRNGLRIEVVEAKNDGTFDIEDWKRIIDTKTRLISVVHSSNVTGTVAPLKEIIEMLWSCQTTLSMLHIIHLMYRIWMWIFLPYLSIRCVVLPEWGFFTASWNTSRRWTCSW